LSANLVLCFSSQSVRRVFVASAPSRQKLPPYLRVDKPPSIAAPRGGRPENGEHELADRTDPPLGISLLHFDGVLLLH